MYFIFLLQLEYSEYTQSTNHSFFFKFDLLIGWPDPQMRQHSGTEQKRIKKLNTRKILKMFLESWFQLKSNFGVKRIKIFLSMNQNDKNSSFLL